MPDAKICLLQLQSSLFHPSILKGTEDTWGFFKQKRGASPSEGVVFPLPPETSASEWTGSPILLGWGQALTQPGKNTSDHKIHFKLFEKATVLIFEHSNEILQTAGHLLFLQSTRRFMSHSKSYEEDLRVYSGLTNRLNCPILDCFPMKNHWTEL